MTLGLSRIIALGCLCASASLIAQSPKTDSLLLIVTDPLSRELACACVKGYGQRDYRKLAARLDNALKDRVAIEFSDDLAETLATITPNRNVLVIGDASLVSHGANKAGLKCTPICELTDLDGNTGQTASFVVRSDDPAKEFKDISGRKLFVGLSEFDEKYSASFAALRAAGIEPPSKPEKQSSYSDAALDLLDSESSPLPVAIVPTYAIRMLEGCGSVKPGNLRTIGKTVASPFITVYLSDATPDAKRERILNALLAVKSDAKLLNELESRDGFKPIGPHRGKPAAGDWPDWRGPNRDGHVPQLPRRLPEAAKIIWKKGAVEGGLAGLCVSGDWLISAERDLADENDVYRCLSATTGELLWRIHFPARGKLDYGQAPRATPVIHANKAYLLGAFGDLRCVSAADGKLIWQRQLLRDFNARLPTWGMCSPPLIVNDLIIVNPGGANASLVALDCETGRTQWKTAGAPSAYAAFISAKCAGQWQFVGYDQNSLGGWDVKTGKRLWRIVPEVAGDFNVPTPILVKDEIVVATENNGTRLYKFDEAGALNCAPTAHFADLSPDTISPVVTSGRVFGAARQTLYCLDIQHGLKPVWHCEEENLGDHATLIADDERVLVITLGGELILLDAKSDHCKIISRLRLFDEEVEVYSHPALVGSRLYVRGGSSLICANLSD